MILLGYHAVKKALAERGGLAEGFPDDAKAGLLVAADSAGIPGTHLQIKGLAGKQAPRKHAGDFGHLPAIAFAAMGRCNADAEEDFGLLLVQIDKANQFFPCVKGIEMIERIGKAKAFFLLLRIRCGIVDCILTFIFPRR